MALPLDVLIRGQTKEQVQAAILSICSSVGLKVTAWQKGGVALTLIGVFADFFAQFSGDVALFVRGGYLDLATGGYLTLLAYYVFNVLRIAATYAAGDCTVVNASGGLYNFKVGKFIASNPTTGCTYVNTAEFTLQPTGFVGSTQAVPMKAQKAGAAGTSSAATITKVVTSASGVSITNPVTLLGVDEELDDALRLRCRDKLGTLSPNGPHGAYAFVAESATDGGVSLGVSRVSIVAPTGTGLVDMYVASPSGAMPGSAIPIINDLAQRQSVPDSVRCIVHNSVNKTISFLAEFWIYRAAGLTDAAVGLAAQASMNAYFQKIPIGGFVLNNPPGAILFRAIEAELAKVSPYIIEVKLSFESDIPLAANEVAVPGVLTWKINTVLGP